MELDLELWQKLYYKTKQQYLRNRLIAIKYLYENKSRSEISKIIGCTYKTLTTWIDIFLRGGLEALVIPIKHNVKQRLSAEQKSELKEIILNKSPLDYGIDRNMWTGEIIASVIYKKWGVSYKLARVYEILHDLGLSYQRAHRDYANADPEQQKQFVKEVKETLESSPGKTRVMFFDEFAVSDRPSTFYGWAEVNTRPQVLSDEKKAS
jgi:transposase